MPLLSVNEEVAMLQKYIADGDEDLDAVTDLLGKVIESGAWACFSTPTGKVVEHASFREFVTAKRFDGLGTTREALTAWVGAQNPELAKQIETVWKSEVPAANVNGGDRRSEQFSGTELKPNRETADAITARLKRDDPDLAAQVINGEISAHAAALKKGYRKPRIVLSNPTSVAAQVRKHFTDYEIRDLINELGELL